MSGAQPVTSQSTQQQQSSSNDDDETGISTAHAQLVTQNLIVGNVPFERTQLFSDPTITMVSFWFCKFSSFSLAFLEYGYECFGRNSTNFAPGN